MQFDTIEPPRSVSRRTDWETILSDSGYFFAKKTMRFFHSRVAWETLANTPSGFAFITSEQHQSPFGASAWDGQRRYTIREWTREDGVNTIGEFGEYATLQEAKRDLASLTKPFPYN